MSQRTHSITETPQPPLRFTRDRFRQLGLGRLLDLADLLNGSPVPGITLSEDEFIEWCPDEVRAEWVDGKVVLMSPSSVDHDELDIWFIRLLGEFVEVNELGAIFQNIFVRLPNQRRRRVPDILFVSKGRLRLMRPTYLKGAPDLIIEIISPDSQSRDRREKYLEYEKAGVREYWIVDPLSRTVEVFKWVKGRFVRVEEVDGVICSVVLKGFRVKTAELWRKPLPKVAAVMKWMKKQ